MELKEIISAIFQYGGTIIMAALFVYVFFSDRKERYTTLEDNTKMLQALAQSNNNIAKSLDIISNNLITIDKKIDRNYEVELKNNSI